MTTAPLPLKPQRWAILELFGHQRIAGAISEEVIGGASLVRVDVPEVRYTADGAERVIPAHTACFGAAAIYSVRWVDEAMCLLVAQNLRSEPVNSYTLLSALERLSPGDRQLLLRNDRPVRDDEAPY